MKYRIDTMVAAITEENMEDIKEIFYGEPYDVISVIEGGEIVDDENMAREEFKNQWATARRHKDGTIEIRIPELICGEAELDKDTLDEFGDEVNMMTDYEVIDRKEFDEDSIQLVRELGYTV